MGFRYKVVYLARLLYYIAAVIFNRDKVAEIILVCFFRGLYEYIILAGLRYLGQDNRRSIFNNFEKLFFCVSFDFQPVGHVAAFFEFRESDNLYPLDCLAEFPEQM
jgi:hypothetical protein